ncbi:MAG: VTT domain-containing protein [Gemmatimonadota bacterium]|nr:VTT domain-containing protein [Gemmatimonadota bacterium]
MSRGARARALRLVARVHGWAESGWARSGAAFWAFLQSAFVPGPADALLAPLGLADPPRVFELALWSAVGSVLGCLTAFGIGAAGTSATASLLHAAGMTGERMLELRALLAEHRWPVILIGGALPVLSTKLLCVTAGAMGLPFLDFALAIAAARAARYAGAAALIHFAGDRLLARFGIHPAADGERR